jgi:hypothetical protein
MENPVGTEGSGRKYENVQLMKPVGTEGQTGKGENMINMDM